MSQDDQIVCKLVSFEQPKSTLSGPFGLRYTIYRLNRSGLKLQPCLTPFSHGNGLDIPESDRTTEVSFLYMSCSNNSNFILRPALVRLSQSLSWLMESKAFLKSTKQA